MSEEAKKWNMTLCGWKAIYEDKEYSSENNDDWKSLPREGMLLLQRFYKIYDENGELYIQDGKDTFHEFSYGQPLVALTVDSLKLHKRLPKEIKFMKQMPKDEIEEKIKEFENG